MLRWASCPLQDNRAITKIPCKIIVTLHSSQRVGVTRSDIMVLMIDLGHVTEQARTVLRHNRCYPRKAGI